MLGSKPTDLLKLISRTDNLSSDDYKNRVVDRCPKLFKGLGVMNDSSSASHSKKQIYSSVSSKEITLPLVSGKR